MFVYISLIFILIIIDQVTKQLIENNLTESFTCLNGLFEIHYSQNTGISFSLLAQNPIALTVVNSIVMCFLLFYFFKKFDNMKLEKIAFVFIIAGGFGNLLDRYLKGYVVDFINPLFIDFAIFNLADIFLNIGVFLMIIEVLFARKSRAKS